MKKLLLLIFLILSLHINLFPQLSGSYTVGQPGDDFPTLDTAFIVLFNQGMSGPVEFLLSNGNYNFLSFYSFNPLSNDTLKLRSSSGIPDSVIFTGCRIANSKNIIIKDIGFYRSFSNGSSLVHLDEVINVRFSGCRIIDDITTNYNPDEATIKIDHSWNGPVTTVYIDSCFISGLSGIFPYIFSEYTIIETGNKGRTYFTMDSIIGRWDISSSNDRYYRDCYLRLDHLDEPGNRLFESCIIDFFPDAGSFHHFSGSRIEKCQFFGPGTLSLETSSWS